MADDFWSRKRKEEEEEERRQLEEREREEALQKKRKSQGIATGGGSGESGIGPVSERLETLIQVAVPLIEQVNQLYIRYSTGEQSRPPLEQRQRLDTMIILMQNIAKTSPADRFRFSTISQSYMTHRSKWEKLLLDVESGKIKRVTGPRRG